MYTVGIALGLGCALSHALCYLFTRAFVRAPGRTTRELLALGHILMAGASLLLLPALWRAPAAGWATTAAYLAGAGVFYLLAQAAFFRTLKHVAASAASPLLGLKIAFVAILAALATGEAPAPAQWLAVGLAVAAGGLLSRTGERLSKEGLAWLLATCLGYALSDLNIRYLIAAIDPAASTGGTLFAVALEYTVCGGFGLYLYARMERVPREAWMRALPFAASWYAAMCFFYGAIAAGGVVFAVILQSTRGILSIALGGLVAHWGWLHLERKIGVRSRLAQAFAALMMTAAIALYILGAA